MATATGSPNEIRMILLGRTGTGKSSFGNTLLSATKFEADFSPNPVTTECSAETEVFDGKRLFVVDTPGFLDPNVAEDNMMDEIAKSYQMTAMPGPHAFLLVLQPTRMTVQENKAVDYLTDIFGKEAIDHTIVIFTHGEDFAQNGTTAEQYLSKLKPDAPLKNLLKQCQQRYLTVNNLGTGVEKRETIKALLDMITKMVEGNERDGVYTSDEFGEVAKFIANEKSHGTFHPFNADGSYALLPKTKEIVIDGYLRRTIGRRAIS